MTGALTRRDLLRTSAFGSAMLSNSPILLKDASREEQGSTTSPAPVMPSFKIALVGAAHIHTAPFLKIVASRPEIEFKMVWDADVNRSRPHAQNLKARCITNRQEIWDDKEVKAVLILSETIQHAQLIAEAAAAQKHIFVEKPLGTGAEDSLEMAKAIEKAGVLFQTGYAMRGESMYLFLREQIHKNHLGKITRARICVSNAGSLEGMFTPEFHWMTERTRAGVGGFGDIGTHALDFLMWCFGDIRRATATISGLTANPEDGNENGEAILEFENGVTAVLSAGWADRDNPMPVYFGGTEGYAYKLKDRFYYACDKVDGADGRRAWTKFPPAWPHPLELFFDALGGKADIPLISPREAAQRCAVMAALYQAAAHRTWIDIQKI